MPEWPYGKPPDVACMRCGGWQRNGVCQGCQEPVETCTCEKEVIDAPHP
jgi:hypothetical protein